MFASCWIPSLAVLSSSSQSLVEVSQGLVNFGSTMALGFVLSMNCSFEMAWRSRRMIPWCKMIAGVQRPRNGRCHSVDGCGAVKRSMKRWAHPISSQWMVVLCIGQLIRVGEARVPGPQNEHHQSEVEWFLGTCNPSGLPNKAHLLNMQLADLWCISETHLSKHGQRSFMKQLAAEKSDYKWCATGWPVPPRSNVSFHGGWSGVAVVSRHPTRNLPDCWSPEIAQSSRIMCAATLVHDLWVTGVTVYGVPIGPTHPNARAASTELLEAAIDLFAVCEWAPLPRR